MSLGRRLSMLEATRDRADDGRAADGDAAFLVALECLSIDELWHRWAELSVDLFLNDGDPATWGEWPVMDDQERELLARAYDYGRWHAPRYPSAPGGVA